MSRPSQEKAAPLGEKATPSSSGFTPPAPTKKGFFGRKTRTADPKGAVTGGGAAAIAMMDDMAEQNAEVAAAEDGKLRDVPDAPKAVGMLEMFRYSTRGEAILMLFGLVAAGASSCYLVSVLNLSLMLFPMSRFSCHHQLLPVRIASSCSSSRARPSHKSPDPLLCRP